MTGTDVRTKQFDFHGSTLRVTGNVTVWELLHSRLGRFPSAEGKPAELAVEFVEINEPPARESEPTHGATRVIYESRLGQVLFAEEADKVYVNYSPRVAGEYNLPRGAAKIHYQTAEEGSWVATHHLLTLFLMEWLKRRELYSLHAAGVSIEGKGVLLAGPTGSGKSTLALAMVRAGYGLLGDDLLFLEKRRSGLHALAFPEDIDITQKTAALYPELHFLMNAAEALPRKQSVCPEQVYDATIVWSCSPAVLVFPVVGGGAANSLRQMERGEALIELAPNVLLTEPRTSQKHLDALSALVKQCECFRLEMGRDVGELPGLLSGLVREGGDA